MTRLLLVAALMLAAGCAQSRSEVAEPPVVSPTGTRVQREALTAEQIAGRLKDAGLPISDVRPARADDPLLGSSEGYVSLVTFTDARVDRSRIRPDASVMAPDRGGSVEVFATEAKARERSGYIRKLIVQLGALTDEHHYSRGGILVRVSGLLTAVQARVYETTLTSALR